MAVATSLALSAIDSHAQDADRTTLQEIVVTATKREQSVQEVPLSVSGPQRPRATSARSRVDDAHGLRP